MRGETLLGGGRGRRPSRRQRWLRADESRMDAGLERHRVSPENFEAVQSRGGGGFRCRVQAVELQGRCGRDTVAVTNSWPGKEIVATCAAQCAASNRPQAGCGDCALHL